MAPATIEQGGLKQPCSPQCCWPCAEVFTSGEVQPALDMYSLGIVLYWMVAREEPFVGLAPYQVRIWARSMRAWARLVVHLNGSLDVVQSIGWEGNMVGKQLCNMHKVACPRGKPYGHAAHCCQLPSIHSIGRWWARSWKKRTAGSDWSCPLACRPTCKPWCGTAHTGTPGSGGFCGGEWLVCVWQLVDGTWQPHGVQPLGGAH